MFSRKGLKAAVLCAAAAAMSQAAFAQVKVGVVNLQQAVFKTAELNKDQEEMTAKFKPQQDEINKLQAQLQQLAQQIQTQGDKMSAEAQADLQANYQRIQRDGQRKEQDLSDAVTAYRNDVLQKLSQKMTEVVKKLAEEKGLDLVVDSSTTLYVKPAIDLTADAIAAYDKTYPITAAAAPAAAAKK